MKWDDTHIYSMGLLRTRCDKARGRHTVSTWPTIRILLWREELSSCQLAFPLGSEAAAPPPFHVLPRGCQVVLGTGCQDGVVERVQLLVYSPAWSAVVSLPDHLSQWKPLLSFIILFLLATDCEKVKNVLFEAIK